MYFGDIDINNSWIERRRRKIIIN